MLKPQDIVILLKIIALRNNLDSEKIVKQNQLAVSLCISASEVNAAFKRLISAGLIAYIPEEFGLGKNDPKRDTTLRPVLSACEECLVHGIKYFFPVELGTESPGIVTSYAAPIFKDKLVLGNAPIPVWPYAEGKQRGLVLKPLYRSVPKSIMEHPDELFYQLLTIVDVLRIGRARERNIAVDLLREKLKNGK